MSWFFRCLLVAVLLAESASATPAEELLSPALQEVADAYQRDIAAAQFETAQQVSEVRLQTVQTLQALQDDLCRDAKLDEAVAVRDRIRQLTGSSPPPSETRLPPAAAVVVQGFEIRAAALEQKAVERIADAGRRASEPLGRLVEQFCREGRLDDAVQGRALLRRFSSVVADVEPDPGYLSADASQIGETYLFDVVGTASGSIYGTDIYTGDSSIAAAALHSGILRTGERGTVKVTVLPGQTNYVASARHGVTSSAYGQYGVSLKVERVYVVTPLWK